MLNMEQVKIFRLLAQTEATEKEVNDWLKTMGDKVEITRVLQDFRPDAGNHPILLTIFFKKL